MEPSSKMKVVYTIVERGENRSYWTRVGVGFVNRDGSLNLRLEALPINGTLQVRDWEPKTNDGPRAGRRDAAPREAAA